MWPCLGGANEQILGVHRRNLHFYMKSDAVQDVLTVLSASNTPDVCYSTSLSSLWDIGPQKAELILECWIPGKHAINCPFSAFYNQAFELTWIPHDVPGCLSLALITQNTRDFCFKYHSLIHDALLELLNSVCQTKPEDVHRPDDLPQIPRWFRCKLQTR